MSVESAIADLESILKSVQARVDELKRELNIQPVPAPEPEDPLHKAVRELWQTDRPMTWPRKTTNPIPPVIAQRYVYSEEAVDCEMHEPIAESTVTWGA